MANPLVDRVRDLARATRPPGRLGGARNAVRVPGSPSDPTVKPGLPPRAASTVIDLEPRRQELAARVAELQWDLGGLTYEMAIRDHVRVDVLVARAAVLQEADAALAEIERVIRMDAAGASGTCQNCGALHSRGATYCWQCGQTLVAQAPRGQAAAGR